MGSAKVKDGLVGPPETALPVEVLVDMINALTVLTSFLKHCGQKPP